MAAFNPPKTGQPITMGADNKLHVPQAIRSFRHIEGDGTGRDIWRASVRVLDAAVAKAYGGKRKISWFEVFAGEKAAHPVQDPGFPKKRSRPSRSTWSASRVR